MFGCLGDFGIAERALPHWVFGAHAIFLLLLTLHKLFIMQHFFNSYYYYYPRSALFFVHRKMIQPDYILWRHLGWTGGFVNTSLPHAGDFGITLPSCIHRAMSPLRSAELLAPPPRDWLGDGTLSRIKLWPRRQYEHINQLSCLHAQSFKFLTCVRFDQELYFFVKKLLVKIFLVETLFAHTWRATRAHYTWGLL